MSNSTEYQRGYVAGRKRLDRDVAEDVAELAELKKMQLVIDERKERTYMQCLDIVLRNCSGWSVNKKKINNAEGYCRLAKIFADNAVSEMKSD